MLGFQAYNFTLFLKISTTVPLIRVKTVALAQIWWPTSNVRVLQASLERIAPRVSVLKTDVVEGQE